SLTPPHSSHAAICPDAAPHGPSLCLPSASAQTACSRDPAVASLCPNTLPYVAFCPHRSGVPSCRPPPLSQAENLLHESQCPLRTAPALLLQPRDLCGQQIELLVLLVCSLTLLIQSVDQILHLHLQRLHLLLQPRDLLHHLCRISHAVILLRDLHFQYRPGRLPVTNAGPILAQPVGATVLTVQPAIPVRALHRSLQIIHAG